MFLFASAYTGTGIEGWTVTGAKTLLGTFNGASSFNTDISGWDVSNVSDFTVMFQDASVFNVDLCLWGTKITDKDASTVSMFYASGCSIKSDPDLRASPKGPFCAQCEIL
jgi:surface protein